MSRLTKIKRAVSGPYFFSFILIAVGYIMINGLVNKTATNGFAVLKTYSLSFLIPYIILNILVAVLTGITINLTIMKIKEWREFRKINKAGGVAAVGVFTGLLGGACPGCFVGLFPAVAGLFGISASLGVLPLYGLELQIVSVVLLTIGVLLLTKTTTCPLPPIKTKKR